MDISRILIVFGVIFISELPDKSMVASLVLGTRYKKLYVWSGAAAAFLVHVIIAVTAGHLLTLLPQSVVKYIVAALFFAGALLLLFGEKDSEEEGEAEAIKAERQSKGFLPVFSTAFVVIFLGEWGDITQIATTNYAAKYHDPLSVAIGAVLALWSVAALGVVLGSRLLKYIPAKTLQRITAVILLIFAVVSLVTAIRG